MIFNAVLFIAVLFITALFLYLAYTFKRDADRKRTYEGRYHIELTADFAGESISLYLNDSLLMNRIMPDSKRGGLAVCPPSAAAAPKLRLGVNCTRAASLIHVSGVKEPRFPTLGGRKVLYKGFVEGVLSPAKIRRLVI